MFGKSSKTIGMPLMAACAALALLIAPAAAETSKSVTGLLKAKGLGTEDLKGAEDELKVPADWIAKAKQEKGPLLYNGIDDPKLTQKYLAAFKERYPFVEIVYTRGVGAGRAVKPLIAFKSGKLIADVVTAFESSMTDYLAADALENISDLPAWNGIPAQYKDPKGKWAGLNVANWCMAYSTERVKKEDLPATWWDLVKADNNKLANGRVGIANRAHLWLLNLQAAYGKDEVQKKFIPELFNNLKPQLRKEGINAMMKLIAVGEFDIAIPIAEYRAKIQNNRGAKLGFWCPGVVPQYFVGFGMFKNSEHPYTTKLFMNWMLSKEGQLARVATIGTAPSHKDLQKPQYIAFGEEIVNKKPAVRTVDMLVVDLPELYKVWNPAWQNAGGPKGK